MPYKKFKCPVYGVTVYLVWGDRDVLQKFLVKKFNVIYEDKTPEIGCVVEELHPRTGVAQFVMYTINRNYKNNSTKDEILVHETFHLVKKIMDWIGVSLSDDSEETWAHYQEYWFKHFKKVLG